MKTYMTIELTAQDLIDLAKSKMDLKCDVLLDGSVILLGNGHCGDCPDRTIRGAEEAVRIVFELPLK